MAPSTSNPSGLHRALITGCVFVPPKRNRPRNRRRRPAQRPSAELDQPARQSSVQTTSQSPTAGNHGAQLPSVRSVAIERQCNDCDNLQEIRPPLIPAEVRERIIIALSSLRGQRGAPFSFVTSGDWLFADGRASDQAADIPEPQSIRQPPASPQSLKLSLLLKPFPSTHRAFRADHGTTESSDPIAMPSYLASMTMSQTIVDPILGGILTRAASVALFDHFMIAMNAKWEYILDPTHDTHDSVRQRSGLLFSTILFCSSKFASFGDGSLVLATDQFLLVRLCSLARSLAVRAFAEGNRSTETLQSFYLLACWKDAEDDISYIHSGYALRILQDLDLNQACDDPFQAAKRRTWLALYRQDKQQSLFFMRRSAFKSVDEEPPTRIDTRQGEDSQPVLPSDVIACCGADIRRIQFRMHVMIQKTSSTMFPCLLDLLNTELGSWQSKWLRHFDRNGRAYCDNNPAIADGLLRPDNQHFQTLVSLWRFSVLLNIASAVLKQSVMPSVSSFFRSDNQPPLSSLSLDLPTIGQILPANIPGLAGSVEGGCGTLKQLLKIPVTDLRRAPDSVVLLGPNAALFLCLLLCLPCDELLGPQFQKIAIGLISDTASHFAKAVRSPQDTIALHASYLKSLAGLLEKVEPASNPQDQVIPDISRTTISSGQARSNDAVHNEHIFQAAPAIAEGMGDFDCNTYGNNDTSQNADYFDQSLHALSLANLLDTNLWDTGSMILDNEGIL